MKPFSLLILTISCLLLSGAQALSSEADRLRSVIDGALDAVYAKDAAGLSLEEKQAKVRSVLEAEYDLNVVIRRAIGRNWNLMNDQEREQVLELVKQLVVKTYVKAMEGRGRPDVELGKPVQITDKRMEIPSTITVDDTVVKVLYRLGKMRSGWQIYDIVAEDISVVSNYRQQIDDHFRNGNAQGLIEKLKELLTSDNIDADIQL